MPLSLAQQQVLDKPLQQQWTETQMHGTEPLWQGMKLPKQVPGEPL